MARWSEVRGYTLMYTQSGTPDRYARAALVRKRTLLGSAYNVREARAEDAKRSGREPDALGLGRMLSWRWLSEGEAEELLSARLRTLEALGYRVLGEGTGEEPVDERGAWDWLRDLVDGQLERASADFEGVDLSTDLEAEPGVEPDRESAPGGETEGQDGPGPQDESDESESDESDSAEAISPSAAAALSETLGSLGLEAGALLEGLSTILDIEESALREPSAATLATLEPELLAMLLPVWIEHESAELREIGARWLALPSALFEVDPKLVATWSEGTGALPQALAPHLERSGLALLGPDAVVHLAKVAEEAELRRGAQRWRARLV